MHTYKQTSRRIADTDRKIDTKSMSIEMRIQRMSQNQLLWNVIKNTLDTCCEHSKCFTFLHVFFWVVVVVVVNFFVSFCLFATLYLYLCLILLRFMSLLPREKAKFSTLFLSYCVVRNFDFSFYLWPDFSNYLLDVNIFICQAPQLSLEISAKINFSLHLWKRQTKDRICCTLTFIQKRICCC